MSDYKSKSEMKRVEALKVSGGPREWWLGEKVIHHGTETTYWVLSSRPDDEQIKFFGYFPVIEKSAYDALRAENGKLRGALKEIVAKKDMTMLGDCCVDKTCRSAYDHAGQDMGCTHRYGVNRGYAECAGVAIEALGHAEKGEG